MDAGIRSETNNNSDIAIVNPNVIGPAACNSYGTVALSMDVHFLSSPAPGAHLFGEAQELRRGRRTGLYRLIVTDEAGDLIAELHGMAYRKDARFLEDENDV